MGASTTEYLRRVLENARPHDEGKPADYIEKLREADTSRLAVALAPVDGGVYCAGDDDFEFSIQSISKPFVYAIAIEDVGLENVLAKIGVEPSGQGFRELSLQKNSNRPYNPMINAGAITAHSLVVGADATMETRFDRILMVLSRLAGRQLSVDEEVYQAELENAYRNMGLGHMLKAAGIIVCDPAEAVRGYIRQCSIKVSVRDLAVMASVLCNSGVHPRTGEAIMRPEIARQVLSVMATCGMYDGSGEWLAKVGFSAKSGVAGGIMGALPSKMGIATFSPNLDNIGNSVRSIHICEQLSNDLRLHMMDCSRLMPPPLQTIAAELGVASSSHNPLPRSSRESGFICNFREVVTIGAKLGAAVRTPASCLPRKATTLLIYWYFNWSSKRNRAG